MTIIIQMTIIRLLMTIQMTIIRLLFDRFLEFQSSLKETMLFHQFKILIKTRRNRLQIMTMIATK